MKKANAILILLTLASCISKGVSQTPCNRDVITEGQRKALIKEVCIPSGYIISRIYTQFKDMDIDGDGLGDFIFEWNKPKLKLQNGDTTFITAYRMNPDSSYTLLKTFKTIIPIYFKSYTSYEYPTEDLELRKVYDCYNFRSPLYDLEFKAGVISFDIIIDPASGYTLKYRYDPKRNNWFLFSFREWIDVPNEGRQYTDKEMPEQPESIDEFSYQKYLCPELYSQK